MKIDQAKTEFNARAKGSMRDFLRAKSPTEKVESIQRMSQASRTAKDAMKKALADDRDRS